MAVLRSDAFWLGNMVFNWCFFYVFWRLGKKRGQIDRMALLERQQAVLEALHAQLETAHHQLGVAEAHIDNLTSRLAEVQPK